MGFKSSQKDIDLPRNIPIWTWLFDSPASPLNRFPPSEVKGFTDASTGARVSYTELKQHTTHISTALVKRYNFQAGDTISLFSPNTIWYPVAMLSALRLGGIVSGASPAYNVEEMTYALKTGNAKWLMTVPESMAVGAAAAQAAGIPKENVILLEGEMEGFKTLQDLITEGKTYADNEQTKPYVLPKGKTNGDICGFLSFSSGTTGLPKAVMISHQNVIAQSLQILPLIEPTHRKILAVLPSFHITGLVHVLHIPIVLNAEVYMLASFTMPSMLSVVEKYKIEELLLVPPILIRMVRDPVVDNYDLSCIKRFSSGAAPVSEEILQLLSKKFPSTGFKQGYGMTESCSCITATTKDKNDYKYAHTVGEVCASTEIRIVSEEGKELGINQPGELLAKGPQITMGYLNNEKATTETFLPDGFMRTGDQAVIDSAGVVTITDRIKEMIKVKGIGVAPAELEDLLLGHQYVEDCAVMGIPDDYSGERPKCFIVPKSLADSANPGAQNEAELIGLGRELLNYVKEKKVRHKWLKEVEFVDVIPKSASGKILRRVLKNKKDTGVVVREVARAKL